MRPLIITAVEVQYYDTNLNIESSITVGTDDGSTITLFAPGVTTPDQAQQYGQYALTIGIIACTDNMLE